MCLKLRKYTLVVFAIAGICAVRCNEKDYNDCSFIYWKMEWRSAVERCESERKQLLCYKSKKEMDDITEAFRLAAYGNAELEIWLSGKNCSQPQVMDECLILHIRKKDAKLWHYFRQDCAKKYPFVCCERDSEPSTLNVLSTTTASTSTSASTTTVLTGQSCEKVDRRGIQWPETPAGEVAVVPCPGTSGGNAEWLCRDSGQWNRQGPNLRECRSLDVTDLKEKFNTSSLHDALSLLEKFLNDHDRPIFGEDLLDVLALMTSLPDRFLAATLLQPSVNRWSTTRSLVENATSMFDRIIELRETWSDVKEPRRGWAVTRLLSIVDDIGLILADAMAEDVQEQSITGRNLVLQVLKTRAGQSVTLPRRDSGKGQVVLEEGFDSRLRAEEGNVSVLFTLYSDLTNQLTSNNEKGSSGVLNSAVLSVTVSQNRKSRPISRPVKILVEHLLPQPNDTACVFWNMQRQGWDTTGCRLFGGNETHSLCICDHLTNFALLMDYQGLLEDVDQRPFHYVTLVGCLLSIAGLSTCVIVFSFCSYHSQRAWGLRYVIHRNLCLALLLANLLLVVGLDRTDSPRLCSVLAGLLHYFFLSSFSWMLLEGVHIYLLLVVVFASRRSHWEKYYLFGYGSPLVIVIITAIIRPKYYGTDKICWLSQEKGTIWAFMGPAACILLLNVAALILAQYKASRISMRDDNIALFKRWLRVTVILFPVLGVTWVFGFLYIGRRAVVVGYIFAVLNSLQGFCIFVCHCLMDKKARNMVVSSFRKRSASVTTGSSGTHKKSGAETQPLPTPFRDACRRNWNKLHKPWSFCFDLPVAEAQKGGNAVHPKPIIVHWNGLLDRVT